MIIFRYSNKDFLLVLILLFQLFLWGYCLNNFGQFSLLQKYLLGSLHVFLIVTNYQCVSHNFIHNPFFDSKFINIIFSILNSIGILMPQTAYFFYHHNHHAFNNDHIDSSINDTKDLTSTYRFGKNNQEENIIKYSLLSNFRVPIAYFYKRAFRRGQRYLILIETIFLFIIINYLAVAKYKFLLTFLLPIFLVAKFFTFMENYLEHHFANPADQMTDSVSCYNPIYNFIWFNNGYHQEHHFRPKIHWTQIPIVRVELPDEGRRIVKYAHWFNFFRQ